MPARGAAGGVGNPRFETFPVLVPSSSQYQSTMEVGGRVTHAFGMGLHREGTGKSGQKNLASRIGDWLSFAGVPGGDTRVVNCPDPIRKPVAGRMRRAPRRP